MNDAPQHSRFPYNPLHHTERIDTIQSRLDSRCENDESTSGERPLRNIAVEGMPLKRSVTQKIPRDRNTSVTHTCPQRSSSNGNLRAPHNPQDGFEKHKPTDHKGSSAFNEKEGRSPSPEYPRQSRRRINSRYVDQNEPTGNLQSSSKTRKLRRTPEPEPWSNYREVKRRSSRNTPVEDDAENGMSLSVRALNAVKHWLPLDLNSSLASSRNHSPLTHRTRRKRSTSLRQEYTRSAYYDDYDRKSSLHSTELEHRTNSRREGDPDKVSRELSQIAPPRSVTFRSNTLDSESTKRLRAATSVTKTNIQRTSHSISRSIAQEESEFQPQRAVSDYHQRHNLLRREREQHDDVVLAHDTPQLSHSGEELSTSEATEVLEHLESGVVERVNQVSNSVPERGNETIQDTSSTTLIGIDSVEASANVNFNTSSTVPNKVQPASHRHSIAKNTRFRDSIMSTSTTLSAVGNIGQEDHRAFTPPQRGLSADSSTNRYQAINSQVDNRRPSYLERSLPYEPLEPYSFRILIIQPGGVGSKIVAAIKHFNLRDPPEVRYEALSYVWGHEPPIHRIVVNETPCFIRPTYSMHYREYDMDHNEYTFG